MHQALKPAAALFAALVLLTSAAPAWAQPSPSYLSELRKEADRRELHTSRTWILLGHYRPALLTEFKSDVDGPGFFLAPHGKTDPRAELHATLAAFFAPDGDAQCRFPARTAWIRSALRIDTERLPPARCDDFEAWRSTLNAHSVTLVFASAYLNNPASMFGHTFLRLDPAERSRGTDLLAYVVNFAAEPTTTNQLLYAVLGSTGGFAGQFSTVPYYLKVKEYNDLESRDLWEYELDLNPAEVETLVAHMWEVGPHRFDYFYFDENCSYQLLSVLEVARPTLRLTARFPDVVLPADTVRAALANPGFVTNRRYRPSNHAVMIARRDLLTEAEAELAASLTDSDTDASARLERLDLERQALTLDAAIALHRFRAGPSPDEGRKARGRALLIARGKLGLSTPTPTVTPPAPLERGHATHGLGLGAGWDSHGARMVLTLQPALHDLVAPQQGYAPNNEIRFLAASVSLGERKGGLQLEQLDLLRIQSLAPYDPWDPRASWRLHVGATRHREDQCVRGCIYGTVGGGPGVAAAWGDQVIYAYVDAEASAGGPFQDEWRVGLGPSLGLVLEPVRGFRWVSEAGTRLDLDGGGLPNSLVPGEVDGPRFHLDTTLGLRLGKDAQLRLTHVERRGYREDLLTLVVYQ